MASKRKMNGCKSVKCVMDAINKVGCEVHDFFERVPRIVDVPPGYNATKEAIRFNLFRADGVAEHPDYQIPSCVLEAAETIHSVDCPRKFYADLQSSVRKDARRSVKTLMPDDALPLMRRPIPIYGT